jgi:hypothetical protein
MKIAGIVAGVLAVAVVAVYFYADRIANPRIARDLIENPDGEQARKVMLLTLPSGRRIPVNYLREGDRVYAGADGRWWKELVGDGFPVTILVRGESLSGTGRAVLDDPAYRKDVFSRLRPTALPGFGTLVEIRLGEPR